MSLPTTYICLLLAALPSCHFLKEQESTNVPVEAYRVIQALSSSPDLAMVYVSSDNPAFQCLTATLTYLNEERNESTYVWHFRSPIDHRSIVGESIFKISPGERMDQLDFILDGDQGEVYTAPFLYADYESCAVVIIPYYGEDLCILWVALDVVNNIPENCLEAHQDACPVGYRAYESDMCNA